uniref:Uncharacterized protein n=1 Tax=Knipowitschia caucasica TaxID=637954 RepID=A0AAV2KVY0_KNICA
MFVFMGGGGGGGGGGWGGGGGGGGGGCVSWFNQPVCVHEWRDPQMAWCIENELLLFSRARLEVENQAPSASWSRAWRSSTDSGLIRD